MKKILVFTLSLMLILSSVSFAAVSSSGSKSSSRPSTSTSLPSGGSSTRQAAPSSPGSTYKPSAPSSSYSDKAPSSQVKQGTQTNTQQPQQSSGGFWRNAGLFGGGMLLGSMLGHAFGFSPLSGMSSIFGVLFNILILAAIIMGIRYLWNKFRSNNDRRNM